MTRTVAQIDLDITTAWQRVRHYLLIDEPTLAAVGVRRVDRLLDERNAQVAQAATSAGTR